MKYRVLLTRANEADEQIAEVNSIDLAKETAKAHLINATQYDYMFIWWESFPLRNDISGYPSFPGTLQPFSSLYHYIIAPIMEASE